MLANDHLQLARLARLRHQRRALRDLVLDASAFGMVKKYEDVIMEQARKFAEALGRQLIPTEDADEGEPPPLRDSPAE
jgi:hypothetical protein